MPILHVDETGINTGGARGWLHNASNDKYTCFYLGELKLNLATNELPVQRGKVNIIYYHLIDCLLHYLSSKTINISSIFRTIYIYKQLLKSS